MKKLILLVAAAFLITGCASDSANNGSASNGTNKYPNWIRGASLNLKGDGLNP
jgi:hypothetical protein